MAAARSDALTDRLYDLGFFLVEAFAALEVTAVIVANARITDALGLREELSSWILNSYLYPLFAVMVLLLVLSRWLDRRAAPLPLFLAGLGLFAAGNLACSAAGTPWEFFVGRAIMGVGGAASFAGQLWTLSAFHHQRITRPLVWGEVGAALGVVAGPLVGAVFAQASAQGWRHFFLVNAGLALATALFAFSGLRGRRYLPAPAPGPAAAGDGGRALARTMTAWQVAVSILIVGAEYLFSDYLQAKAGKSPMFVGGMTVLASLGAIAGSLWAARLEHRLRALPAGPRRGCWRRWGLWPDAWRPGPSCWPGCRSSRRGCAWGWPASASTPASSRPRRRRRSCRGPWSTCWACRSATRWECRRWAWPSCAIWAWRPRPGCWRCCRR